MTRSLLYRISPPIPYRHDLEGMTGTIDGTDGNNYLLALTCRPGVVVPVPRSWLRPVPPGPMTAAQYRAAMQREAAA